MTEDFGYGDCRDFCMAYMIEGGYACISCLQEMDEMQRADEGEFPEMYDQGGP